MAPRSRLDFSKGQRRGTPRRERDTGVGQVGQVRSGQVKRLMPGRARSEQVKPGQFRSGHTRSGRAKSIGARPSLVGSHGSRSGRVRSSQVRQCQVKHGPTSASLNRMGGRGLPAQGGPATNPNAPPSLEASRPQVWRLHARLSRIRPEPPLFGSARTLRLAWRLAHATATRRPFVICSSGSSRHFDRNSNHCTLEKAGIRRRQGSVWS